MDGLGDLSLVAKSCFWWICFIVVFLYMATISSLYAVVPKIDIDTTASTLGKIYQPTYL
jgi:hypothetical protein